MEQNRYSKFKTIRQVAKEGILTEHCLRRLARDGLLPAIKAGNRVLINLDRLLEQLDDGSLQKSQEAVNGIGDKQAI